MMWRVVDGGSWMVTQAALAAVLMGAGCARQVVERRTPAKPPTAVAVNTRRQILNAADAGEGDPVANRLRQRMAAEPDQPAPRLELAAHYATVGFPELELEHLRLAVERFPHLEPARVALAGALRRQGMHREAIAALEALPAEAAGAETLNLLGICYDELGEWKAGEQAFRRALAVAPRLDYLHNNLGYNLLEQERIPEAVAVLEQAVKQNPRSAAARNNLGLALARSPGRGMADALAHFENTTDAATAHSNLAAALIEQSRYQESRRLLEAALGFNRSHPEALANLKLLAERDGRPVTLAPRSPHNPWWWPLSLLRRIFLPETEPQLNRDREGATSQQSAKGEPR